VLKKSLMAALIGSSCGAAAGYWTPPGRAAIGAAATVEVPNARAGVVPVDVSAPSGSEQVSRPLIGRPGALEVESGDAVRRARELAQRPDVTALVALRAAVLRRAEQAGRKDDPGIVREIQEIDRYLFEARALRLRLDAAAIRKGT
jgi:multidrug efflux pump subunit AcrA (membrane-fusion protein)